MSLTDTQVSRIKTSYDILIKLGLPSAFAEGLLGNIWSETAGTFDPGQVQLTWLRAHAGADNIDYYLNIDKTAFINDRVGFGLCQWTTGLRKERLWDYLDNHAYPLDNQYGQLSFIVHELSLTGYATCRKAISENWGIDECARIICEQYERPKSMQTDEKENAIQTRIAHARYIHDEVLFKKEDIAMNKGTICIDQGHVDFSNRSPVVPEYWESTSNWLYGRYLGDTLRAHGYSVKYTRNKSTENPDLVKRGLTAKGCILFISVHSNACGTESVDRPVVIYPESYSVVNVEKNRELATLLANNCAKVMGTAQKGKVYSKPAGYDRNKNSILNDDEYYGVMHGAQQSGCPMYMIYERSFHTNTRSAKWLLNENNLKALAESDALVIANYLSATDTTDVVEDITTPTIEYRVKKGDTLRKIASNFNTSVEEILIANPSINNPNKIYVNQILTVPSFLTGKVDDVNYVIQKGDTLSAIAKQYNTTYIKLAAINGILNPSKIYPGQVIKLK